jgi:hypothetical protein
VVVVALGPLPHETQTVVPSQLAAAAELEVVGYLAVLEVSAVHPQPAL